MRLRAARAASEAGLLPDGPVRTWVRGKWQDTIHYQFDITWEPMNRLSPAVAEILATATRAVRKNKPEEAERLLLQALELAPDTPEVLNNLAVAYERQGRKDEALALIRRIHEDYPDYFFGNITMANVATSQGAFDEAHEPVATTYRPTNPAHQRVRKPVHLLHSARPGQEGPGPGRWMAENLGDCRC